ncbi:hypothetical protein AGMMS50230_07050 [Spirochaetia bacterium]|nr:hypothetical protein AGMMS50230_07050 [Spirochaetia bacterium]
MQTKRSPISEPRRHTEGLALADQRFRRQEHLKKRVEITRVFKKGRAVSCPGVRLFFLTNGLSHNRIVITFVRKYGNAVQRNRARRTSREAYRLLKGGLKTGYDLVLLFYPRVSEGPEPQKRPDLAESAGHLKILFKKAGI